MAIIVKPINELFKIKITDGEEKLEFFIKQLDYKTKSLITSLTTKIIEGQIGIDSQMTCFYNIKYALKDVSGLENVDGTPYELAFENSRKEALTDACVDELLATSFSDLLLFSAQKLTEACFPDKILHPVTGQPLEGVEVIKPEELKGTKKKS